MWRLINVHAQIKQKRFTMHTLYAKKHSKDDLNTGRVCSIIFECCCLCSELLFLIFNAWTALFLKILGTAHSRFLFVLSVFAETISSVNRIYIYYIEHWFWLLFEFDFCFYNNFGTQNIWIRFCDFRILSDFCKIECSIGDRMFYFVCVMLHIE